MQRQQFVEAIPLMSHSKSDCKRFLKACDATFSNSITEYRRNFTVLLNDGRTMAYSGMTNNFYDVTPHSNAEWYAYPEFGSFYRLESGKLMYLPMLTDGARMIAEPIEVDFPALSEGFQLRLREIVAELEAKL